MTSKRKYSDVEIQSFHSMTLRKSGISAAVVSAFRLCMHILSLITSKPCRYDDKKTKVGLYGLMYIISDIEMKLAHTLIFAPEIIMTSKVPSGFQDANA